MLTSTFHLRLQGSDESTAALAFLQDGTELGLQLCHPLLETICLLLQLPHTRRRHVQLFSQTHLRQLVSSLFSLELSLQWSFLQCCATF